jgi:PleD family two-component response regulator
MDTATIRQDAESLVASRNPVIAIVDDDELLRGFLAALLKSANCQVLEAACGQDLLALVERQPIDCILLDYHLAAENGLAIHGQIKERFRTVPPIVMLTTESNERTIIKAFRGGVSDYLLKKGLTPEELFKAVADALLRRAEAQAQDAEVSRLRRKSEFDDATGLYSRHAIDDRLARVTSRRQPGRCAVVLIAMNSLDAIAAKFGQVIADRALRAFVSRLKRALVPSEICGCWDDGLFVSITDVDVRFKTVGLACGRLARELAFDVQFEAVGLALSASIGAAIYPIHGRTPADVIAAAEHALGEARSAGKPFAIAPDPAAADDRARIAVVDGEEPQPVASSHGADDEPPSRFATIAPVKREGDRRSVPRQRVLKRGQIVIANLCSAIDCTIRDISPRGARLRVEGHFIAPEEFELVMLGTQGRKPVQTRWQSGNEIGVQFIERGD